MTTPLKIPSTAISRRALWVVFGGALLMRLMAFWSFITSHPRNWFFSHPWEMGLLANSLLHHHGYSSPFGGSTGPTAFIAPGYPTIIAGIFAVFGIYSFTSALVIMGMHIALALCTIWLMMHIATRALDSRTAVIAGAVWAFSLPLLWLPEIFWESSFSECALVGITALALHFQERPSLKGWVVMGIVCAVSCLINPALLFTIVAIMVWLAFQTRSVSRTGPIIGLLTMALLYAPWPIRNAYRFHAFIPMRSTVGFEMWMGNRPGTNGRLDESVFPMFNKEELSSYLAKGEVAYVHDKSAQAWTYVKSHPGKFVDLTARRFVRFWFGTGAEHSSITYPLHAGFTTLFGFVGLVLIYRRGKRELAVLMVLPLILFPVPYYIAHAEFRYRLNIDPLLTVMAAYAVSQLAVAYSRRESAVADNLIERTDPTSSHRALAN